MKRTLRVTGKQHIFEPERWMRSCHASTVAVLADGDVMAAWFGGTREGHVDVGIWAAIQHGGIWQAPVCVARDAQWPCWNPVLQVDGRGVVHLFYKVGKDVPTWHTRVVRSYDNGRTFGQAQQLVAGDVGGWGPVKNKILVHGGRWLAPASIETAQAWEACVDLSDDDGATWRRVAVPLDHAEVRGLGVIQPAM